MARISRTSNLALSESPGPEMLIVVGPPGLAIGVLFPPLGLAMGVVVDRSLLGDGGMLKLVSRKMVRPGARRNDDDLGPVTNRTGRVEGRVVTTSSCCVRGRLSTSGILSAPLFHPATPYTV
ncbi:hypothetical protein M9H77_04854 [Catharanthus roseus]|uniref:Uncharacterized protein n=1 Tax=Catharanthus roseus TaxID=4058 RepID=A0ACC0CFE3_CATRO|nr:hypothetical protein M9H77_04854 [Catharanthus roseus]